MSSLTNRERDHPVINLVRVIVMTLIYLSEVFAKVICN